MIKFEYTKANGETTKRVGVILTSPQKNFAMLDLSEFSEEECKDIAQRYTKYQEALKELRLALEAKFELQDVMKMYKAFKPEGVKNVEQF
jgi:regulator of sigma D